MAWLNLLAALVCAFSAGVHLVAGDNRGTVVMLLLVALNVWCVVNRGG